MNQSQANGDAKGKRVTLADLMERLRRMYEAIGDTNATRLHDGDILGRELLSPEGRPVGVKWDYEFEKRAPGLAMAAIHGAALFQNHCLTYAKEHGIPRAEVDDVAKNCVEVRIIRDLDNNDKHPESDNNSSGLNPKIRNINSTMQLGERPMQWKIVLGRSMEWDTGGAVKGVTAEIVNEKTEEVVGELTATLSRAVGAWEEFLKRRGIT